MPSYFVSPQLRDMEDRARASEEIVVTLEKKVVELEGKVTEFMEKESSWKAREEDLSGMQAEWDEERMTLQKGCIDGYEEGFAKAMR